MRWEIWWKGALASGVLAVIAIGPTVFQNGITATEGWSLLCVFCGGIYLWQKEHKLTWDGVDRRQNPQ